MWPTPCGKNSACAPRSTRLSGSPRSSPNSTRPSAMTSAAVRCTSRHSVPAMQRSVARVARRRDDRVQLLLLRREPAGGRIRAGDVAGVAAVLGAGVDQDQVAVGEPARARREVQHRRVRAAADDRVEGERVGAAPEEGRLELDLQLALAPSRLDQRRDVREAGARGPLGGAHPRQLDGVLLAPDVVQAVAQVGLELGRRGDLRHAPRRGRRPDGPCAARARRRAPPPARPSGSPSAAPSHRRSSRVTGTTKSTQPSCGSKARTPPGRSRSVR